MLLLPTHTIGSKLITACVCVYYDRYRNIVKHRRKLKMEKKHELAAEFDFVPSTFVLPKDYALFVEEFKRRPGTYLAAAAAVDIRNCVSQ